MIRLAALAAALLLTAPALAQQPYNYPQTIGTGSVQILSANPLRKQLILQNASATAIVAVCPTTSRINGVSVTAAVNGQGCIQLLPYQSMTFTAAPSVQNGAVGAAWVAAASAGSTPITVLEFE